MVFYKPEQCTTISMEDNNRYRFIFSLYNVSDNINQSLLWKINFNIIWSDKFYPTTFDSIFYKLYYPYYCQKLNVQD